MQAITKIWFGSTGSLFLAGAGASLSLGVSNFTDAYTIVTLFVVGFASLYLSFKGT